MKKQRTQYSGAALSSGASTSYEQKATVSSKVKGVLSKILSKNSPNGDDLERLDKFLEYLHSSLLFFMANYNTERTQRKSDTPSFLITYFRMRIRQHQESIRQAKRVKE